MLKRYRDSCAHACMCTCNQRRLIAGCRGVGFGIYTQKNMTDMSCLMAGTSQCSGRGSICCHCNDGAAVSRVGNAHNRQLQRKTATHGKNLRARTHDDTRTKADTTSFSTPMQATPQQRCTSTLRSSGTHVSCNRFIQEILHTSRDKNPLLHGQWGLWAKTLTGSLL